MPGITSRGRCTWRRVRRSSEAGTTWSRRAPSLGLRRGRRPPQRGGRREALRVSLFLGGMLLRRAANVQPARLALGLRARVIDAGVRLYEGSAVRKLARDAVATTAGGTVRAEAAVLAVNSATAGFAGYRLAHAVASSHMVITEPVPDVIDEVGWTGGENIHDCRTLLHYFRTTRDGASLSGWGGGRMGSGVGIAAARCRRGRSRACRRGPPQVLPAAPRPDDHARLGRPDRRLPHAPSDLRLARQVHHGFGFTGNGVGPSYLGGEILARLALDRRDELTRLALVEPDRKLMPPEPLAGRRNRDPECARAT